jgi:hypothetical protein
LRERGATVHIVGESKTPDALRHSSDQFFEWVKPAATAAAAVNAIVTAAAAEPAAPASNHCAAVSAPKAQAAQPEVAKPVVKRRPMFVVEAVKLLADKYPAGKVHLGGLGQLLKTNDPAFKPQIYGFTSLRDMLNAYDLLSLQQETAGNWTVQLRSAHEAAAVVVFNDIVSGYTD